MHDILEGVASLEMYLLLKHCIISEQYLTLDEYNHRLTHFDYGYAEVSKPSPIGSRSILQGGKSLRISASLSLLLIRILPFVIGDIVPQNWRCFMLLSKIVDLVISPVS